ncbi:hypothetical protein E2C01_084243 [Portunus trituberculatus]|uniref:Uncharacterized protein n=1 Tax=Portunus trituberculatus TaxID=210409 RepID=A0A5B7J4A5_PORTR|nr:hypothetical protein [Portunus trituberculatus]
MEATGCVVWVVVAGKLRPRRVGE